MQDAARELWGWVREHAGVLFLCTVAALTQMHYDIHGPSAHLLILPANAAAMFLVVPLWGAIVYDCRSSAVTALASLGAALAVAPALVWAYAEGGKEALRAAPMWVVSGTVGGFTLVLVAALLGRLSFSAWGLGPGDFGWWRRPVGLLLLLTLVGIPIVAYAFPEFVAFYPRYKPARTDLIILMQYQLGMWIYMFTWEFLFRGFMLFGLSRFVGPFAAILIQSYPFFVLHHGKPEPEYLSSWFGGLLMGWLCWRSKSMWPSFLLHSVLYSTMEITAFVYRN